MPARRRTSPARRTSASARVALTATVAALTVQPFIGQPAQAAVTVTPKPTRTLPAAMDVVPTYQDQRSCDPAAKPGVEAYARMVGTTYRQGRSGGIVRGCGLGSTSEHKEGRALDWMLSVNNPAEKAAGDALTTWLTGTDELGVVGGNARRLGVMYVIWNRHIWSTYRVGSGWRPYSGPNPHTDHVHTSFTWDGAMQRTSWWDGSATEDDDTGPCRVYVGQPAPVYTARHVSDCTSSLPAAPVSSYPIVWPGQSGSTVKVAQTKLGVASDGVFGSGTRSKLMGWQRTTKVPVTGVLDKPTWARLAPDTTATPPAVPTPPTPTPTPPTPPAPPAPKPPAGPDTVKLAKTTSLTPYKSTVLRSGSRGDAVKALQKALGLTVDGGFGPKTTAGVKAFQTYQKLTVTGVVDKATWDSLERAAYPLLPYRSTTLGSGSRGSAVTALQRALHLTADGAFGPKTDAAVKVAQAKAKLAATGVVGVTTWIAIEQQAYPLGRPLVPVAKDSVPKPAVKPAVKPVVKPVPKPVVKPVVKPIVKPAVKKPTTVSTAATSTSVSAYKKTVLRTGSRGAAVSALQRALGMKQVDGAFGAGTAKTVKSFQHVEHLKPTGLVDRATWDKVERVAYPLLAYRTKVLRTGSTGSSVKALQKALKLSADGGFGSKTKAAVQKAQAKGRIARTGVVATLTWVVIEKQAYPLGKKRW